MIAALITKDRYGLYHVTNAGQTTWYDFACEIFRRQGIHIRVAPISTSEYPTKAQRPAYSVLNCAKAESVTGIKMPPWQDALGRYLDEERARSNGSRHTRWSESSCAPASAWAQGESL